MTDLEFRKRRIRFRAWHRGTKEADLLIGGFSDLYLDDWDEAQVDWFEALIAENDVDIMAWAIGREPFPDRYRGPLADAMLKLDYIPVAR